MRQGCTTRLGRQVNCRASRDAPSADEQRVVFVVVTSGVRRAPWRNGFRGARRRRPARRWTSAKPSRAGAMMADCRLAAVSSTRIATSANSWSTRSHLRRGQFARRAPPPRPSTFRLVSERLDLAVDLRRERSTRRARRAPKTMTPTWTTAITVTATRDDAEEDAAPVDHAVSSPRRALSYASRPRSIGGRELLLLPPQRLAALAGGLQRALAALARLVGQELARLVAGRRRKQQRHGRAADGARQKGQQHRPAARCRVSTWSSLLAATATIGALHVLL